MPRKVNDVICTTTKPRYTVVIQWSDEDECYVVSLPEWGGPKTHGDTYEEAARNAQEVLELLMEDENGHPVNLPVPRLFHFPGADVVDLPDDIDGDPVALQINAEDKGEDRGDLENDPQFWRKIEKSRQEPTVPYSTIKEQLLADDRMAIKPKAKLSKTRRKV